MTLTVSINVAYVTADGRLTIAGYELLNRLAAELDAALVTIASHEARLVAGGL